jgi:hypothetical protein
MNVVPSGGSLLTPKTRFARPVIEKTLIPAGLSRAALCLSALLSVFTAGTCDSRAETAWTLVWADEFAQPDGSSPDPSR